MTLTLTTESDKAATLAITTKDLKVVVVEVQEPAPFTLDPQTAVTNYDHQQLRKERVLDTIVTLGELLQQPSAILTPLAELVLLEGERAKIDSDPRGDFARQGLSPPVRRGGDTTRPVSGHRDASE